MEELKIASSNDPHHEVITKKDNFYKVKLEIEKKIKEFISSGIEWLPINKISLDKEKTKSVINFLETLEDDDDVQHVYANLEIDSNFAEKISNMIIFGIDPGVSGAISVLENKKVIEVFDMPTMIDGKKNKNK